MELGNKILINENKMFNVMNSDSYYCFNKLSDLVYKGENDFFYKLRNRDFYLSQSKTFKDFKLLYNVEFEYKNVIELMGENMLHNQEVQFQIILMMYILYREKIHYDELIIDVYNLKTPKTIDVVIGGGYYFTFKTFYQIKLSGKSKLSSTQLYPQVYYIFIMKKLLNMEFSQSVNYAISKINDVNFIILILFQFDYARRQQQYIAHGGNLSVRDINKYQYYDVGNVFEFRNSPIRIVRCVLIGNMDSYNNNAWVYDLENQRIEEKSLDSLKLVDGYVMGSVTSTSKIIL